MHDTGTKLSRLLQEHVGETGLSEGAEEVLERILVGHRERMRVPKLDLKWPTVFVVRYNGTLEASVFIVRAGSFEEGVALIEADTGCSVEDGDFLVKQIDPEKLCFDFELPLRCIANPCAAGDSELTDRISILEFVRDHFETDGDDVRGRMSFRDDATVTGDATIRMVMTEAFPNFAALLADWEGERTPDVERVVEALRRDASCSG